MASIESNLETIKTAVYGRDMRQAIYEAINELNSGGKMDDVMRKIDDSHASIVNQIVTSETAVASDIENAADTVSNKIDTSTTTVTNKIDASTTTVTNKIEDVESGMYQNNLLIKTWIGASETNVSNKIETAQNSLSDSISTTGTYTNNTVNNARDNILGIIGLPSNDTVSKDIADVKTTLSQDTADIKTTVTNSKTVIMDKLGSSDIPIDVQLVNMKADLVETKYEVLKKVEKSKSELSDELKALKEYIEDKHNETLDEMRKTKLEIIRTCVDLADELSPWRGVVSGQALEIPVAGICVESYIYTAEEE